MVDADARRLLRAALLVSLLLVTLEWAITRVFVLNFSTAGPNATALLTLLLLTGWTVPVAARVDPARRDRALPAFGAVGLLLSLGGTPVVALLGVVLVHAAFTPLLVADTARLRARVGVAFAGGLLAVVVIRAALGAAPLYATDPGQYALVGLLASLLAVDLSLRRLPDARPVALESLPVVAPLVAALFLAVLFLGAPTVPARWAGRPYLAAVALAAVGLVGGGTWVASRPPPDAREAAVAGVVLVGSLVALCSDLVVAVVALAPATGALVVLAATGGAGERSPTRVGLDVAGVQFAGVLLVFCYAVAANWAFVPVLGPFLRGRAATVVLVLALVVVTGAVAAARESFGFQSGEHVALDDARRAAVAGLATGAVGLVASVLRRPRPIADLDPDPEAIRVATYNVHQYFDSRGAYDLRAVASVLRERDLGVVGLQETEGARVTSGNVDGVRWLAGALGYHFHPGPDTGTQSYGVALLSAWPIRDVEVVELPQDDTATRVAMRATVEHADGDLPVVVTHLETAGEIRVRQARRVLDLIADEERAVVLGDFNATPDDRVHEVVTGSLTDAWETAGEGPGYTYPASEPRERIDYVFVRGLNATDAAVFGSEAESDHRGVSATLSPRRSSP